MWKARERLWRNEMLGRVENNYNEKTPKSKNKLIHDERRFSTTLQSDVRGLW
jgi:hypothetical protein